VITSGKPAIMSMITHGIIWSEGRVMKLLLTPTNTTFQHYLLKTKVLSDVRGGHTQLSLFGRHYQHPIFLAPVAYQALFHPQGEHLRPP
jgi:4-hydroxymandelate oxidase